MALFAGHGVVPVFSQIMDAGPYGFLQLPNLALNGRGSNACNGAVNGMKS